MEGWRKYKLGEIITLKYGKDHKKLSDGFYPVYGSGGIMRYGNSYIYDQPSILIPRKGSLNNMMFIDKPFWTVDTMFWSIINDKMVLPRFLYYALSKYDFASLNVGSAVPSLTVPVIENIEIIIPSISEQKQILSTLVPLDDKIALNTRINDNLIFICILLVLNFTENQIVATICIIQMRTDIKLMPIESFQYLSVA